MKTATKIKAIASKTAYTDFGPIPRPPLYKLLQGCTRLYKAIQSKNFFSPARQKNPISLDEPKTGGYLRKALQSCARLCKAVQSKKIFLGLFSTNSVEIRTSRRIRPKLFVATAVSTCCLMWECHAQR
jgi:hypothetical protein